MTGAAGLIYQVVWFRTLMRVFGSTVYATSTLVASFMAGLALGAWFFGRIIDRRRAPLIWYALLEFAIAGAALLLPLAFDATIPLLRSVYGSFGDGSTLIAVRAALSFAILLVPTCFMGATFPILTVLATRRDGQLAKNVGHLYTLNTAGAVLGTLVTGIVLIGTFGENASVGCAVALNVIVASIALYLHGRLAGDEEEEAAHPAPQVLAFSIPPAARRVVLMVFAASGATALAYEVIWTRQLLFFLGTSVYAFSVMLALYLTGIAAGSAIATRRIEKVEDPVGAFGLLEITLGIVSIVVLYLLVPANWVYDSTNRWIRYLGGMLAAGVLVLPATLLLGAIFPMAARAYAAGRSDVGAAVGRAYATNTFGAIIGSLLAGFFLIPAVGTTRAIAILAAVNVLGGVVLLANSSRWRARVIPALLASAAVLVLAVVPLLRTDPFYRVMEDRLAFKYPQNTGIKWHHEDATATVTVFETAPPGGAIKKHLWVNGVGMTALLTDTKVMAHLPMLVGPDMAPGETRKMLVICFGMGTTVRSALLWPDTEVDTLELVPGVVDALRFFHADAEEIIANPNFDVHVGDGRNWLLLSGEKYDVISVDPSPPIFSAGTVNLYSQEFMQLAKDALTEDGLAMFWVSSAVTPDEFKMLMSTFRSVFPEGTVWSGRGIKGYFLMGAKRGAIRVNPERFRRFYEDPVLRADMLEWDDLVGSAESLLGLYVADANRLASISEGYPIITDNYPWVEFPLFRYITGGQGRFKKKRFVAMRDPITPLLVSE